MTHENRLRAHHGLAARQRKGDEDDDEEDEVRPPRPRPPTTTLPRPTITRPTRPVRPTITLPSIPPVTRPTRSIVPTVPVRPTTTTTPPPRPPPRPTTTSSIVSTQSIAPPLVRPITTAITSTTPGAGDETTTANRALSSSNTLSQPSISSTPEAANTNDAPSGNLSSGALAGGIIGGLLGGTALLFIMFFLIRRYRKKRTDSLAFKASQFRRSALMLNDPPPVPEKPQMQQRSGPRPPSTIERHMQGLAVPAASASLPYSEHSAYSSDPYGHYSTSAAQYNVGMYGADGQVARDPYADVYGGNVNSAGYGQHAAYGQAQSPYQQQQFQQPYQTSFSPGQIVPSARTLASTDDAPLPNPFANPASASVALALARSAASAGSPTLSSQPSSPNTDGSPSPPAAASSPYLNRQPTQAGSVSPAYESDARYADVQRDVKVAPNTLNGGNEGSTARPAPATSNAQRPTSTYTLYDANDAYGGI